MVSWTTPFTAVTNAIISSADWNAVRDDLLWIRQFLSAAPGGSNQWLQASSSTAAGWVDRTTAAVAALAGATLTGSLTLANGSPNGLRGLNASAVSKQLLAIDASNNVFIGHQDAAGVFAFAPLGVFYIHDGTSLFPVWHTGNDGYGSGLIADDSGKLGNVAAASYSQTSHTHTSMAKIATGTYTGNGGATRSITGLGFTPKIVFVQKQTTSNTLGIQMTHDMALMLTTTVGYNAGNSLDADGFTVTLGSGMNANTDTYRWTAIG